MPLVRDLNLARLEHVSSAKVLELLDPTATSFTFQTFGDGNTLGHLVGVFEGTLALNKRLKGGVKLTSLDDAYKQGAGVWVTVNETDGTGQKIANILRVRAVWCEFDGAKDGRTAQHFRLHLQWSSRRPPETSISIG